MSPTATRRTQSATSTRPRQPPRPTATSTTAAGLEDVTRALRDLTRSGRDLLVDGGQVLERELSMAISISERVRSETLAASILEEARGAPLNQRLRDDAHRVVDIVADVSGVAVLSAVRFVERFVDEPRPALQAGDRGLAGQAVAVEPPRA